MRRADVTILHWPEDAAVVAYLRAERRARLLLVAPEADAPAESSLEEDWIRLPACEDDIRRRITALEERTARGDVRPEVTTDGRLFFAGRWVSLSPTEAILARLLSRRFGEVLDAETLILAIGGRDLSPNALRVHLTRLRKRLGQVDLVLLSIYGRGWVLEQGRDPGTSRRP